MHPVSLTVLTFKYIYILRRRQAVSKGRTEDERNSTEEEGTDNIRGNDIYNLVLEDIEITTTDLYKNQSNSVSNESSLPTQYRSKEYCYSNGFIESNPYIERDVRPYSNRYITRTSVSGSHNQLESRNETGNHVTFETKL